MTAILQSLQIGHHYVFLQLLLPIVFFNSARQHDPLGLLLFGQDATHLSKSRLASFAAIASHLAAGITCLAHIVTRC